MSIEVRNSRGEFIQIPIRERFWDKVKIPFDATINECWEWHGEKLNGYGAITLNGKTVYAHRISFMLYKNESVECLVRHSCDNKLCVNPNHLLSGSHTHNMNDMVERNRQAYGERCGRSKLTTEQVFRIRELHKTGSFTQKNLAKMFDCSRTNISSILNNNSWAHATQ